MSPTSHAYSEYQACSRLMTDYNEEDDEDFDEKSNYQERRQIQNTIFNHIDWSEFLVPGVSPPQPTPVPDLPSSFSVVSQPGRPGRPRREGVQSLLNMSEYYVLTYLLFKYILLNMSKFLQNNST